MLFPCAPIWFLHTLHLLHVLVCAVLRVIATHRVLLRCHGVGAATEADPVWATFATRSLLAVVAAGLGTDSVTRFACATAVRAARAGGTAGSALWVTGSPGRSLAAAEDAHRESAAERTAGRVAGPGYWA